MGFAVAGLSTCYDLRFPELYGYLTNRLNAELLLVPSAFTVPTGSAHWEILLRSRAIENQCVVIAAAQSGAHNANRSSYGHSMIVDAWGTKAAEVVRSPTQPGDEGICYFEYNRAELRDVRAKMPVEVSENSTYLIESTDVSLTKLSSILVFQEHHRYELFPMIEK